MTHINTFVGLKPLVQGRWYGYRWVVWRVNDLTPHLSPSWCTRILTRQLGDRPITKKVRKEKSLLRDNEVSDYSKTGEIKTLACFN